MIMNFFEEGHFLFEVKVYKKYFLVFEIFCNYL